MSCTHPDGFIARAAGEEGPQMGPLAVVVAGRLVDGTRRAIGRPRHALHHVIVVSQLHLQTKQLNRSQESKQN